MTPLSMRKYVWNWQSLALAGLIMLALLLRLYGLNWDQSNNFHPDERQILFRVTALGWPESWTQFFDAVNSPLNPHFFAYGSFPLYLLALVGVLLGYNLADPGYFVPLTLAGRVLSALFDCGTILLTALLALRLGRILYPHYPTRRWNFALLVGVLLAFTPLHLQLSHFYAVDTVMAFFVMLSLLACVVLVETSMPVRWSIVVGIAYGLALATKISAYPLVFPIVIAVFLRWQRERDVLKAGILLLLAGCMTLVFFFLTQPYVLIDRATFITQVLEQSQMAQGILDFPYTRQFAGTLPYLYHIQNILFWGLGLMLGCSALLGFVWLLWRIWQRKIDVWLILLGWIVVYGAVTAGMYVKFMRYMLPLYPALVLVGSAALLTIVYHTIAWRQMQGEKRTSSDPTHESALPISRRQGVKRSLLPLNVFLSLLPVFLVLGGTIFQGIALLNVYSQPNTRVQASRWIYENIPSGSVITYEQWDDPLPVSIDGKSSGMYYGQATYERVDAEGNHSLFQGMDLYGDDTLEKAQELAQLLSTVDVIIMSSDRLYGSIMRLPERYPLTVNYYRLLFSGELGFRLSAQFEQRPEWLGVTLNDSGADESYSVFDHPTCRIFERMVPYPYTSAQLVQKLLAGVDLSSP